MSIFEEIHNATQSSVDTGVNCELTPKQCAALLEQQEIFEELANQLDHWDEQTTALRAAIAEKDAEIARLKEELDATSNRAIRYAITITELRDEIDEYASHRKQEE